MLLPAVAFNPGIFLDSTFRVIGSSDTTKKIAFEVDAQSTGAVLTFNTGAQTTSRSLTAPVLTGNRTLAVIDQAQTFSALTTHSAGLTVSSGTTAVQALTATGITNSGLTSGRVPYSSTGGLAVDSDGFLFALTSTASLSLGNGTSLSGNMILNGAVASQPGFFFQAAGSNRWLFRLDAVAESGSNAGSGFTIVARSDTGTNIDTPFAITRASGGAVTIARPLTLSTASTGLTIAATSGTTLTVSSTTDSTSSSTGCTLFSGGTYTAKNSLMGQGMGFGVTSTATAAGTTTLTTASRSVQVFTGTTTQTVTLPAANAFGAGIGVVFIIKNRSTGNVTINRAGSDTIDGGTSTTLTGGANASVTLASNGVSEWVIV